MKKKHTSTPWKANTITSGWIEDSEGTLVAAAQCHALHSAAAVTCTAAQMAANAEFIVKAVNSHDDLLAACRTVVTRLGTVCERSGSMQEFLDAGSMAEIQAAITKATS